MRKTIIINNIECQFKSSAAVPRMYRLKFGRDIFVDMTKLKKQIDIQKKLQKETGEENSSLPIESLEMFENIAFLMHKHGDKTQPSEIDEWLEQFETFDIYEILPEILEMWNVENKQMSTPKKETGK